MEVLLFSLMLGVGAGIVFREAIGRRGARRWMAIACAVVVSSSILGATSLLSAADDDRETDGERPDAPPVAEKKWIKPRIWPEGHPLPIVESNCAACHLTAGRELTAAVVNFTRSVHDLNEMSCADCHGGNTEDDVKAHEEEFDFIGTKKSAHIAGCSDCHTEEAEVLASGSHNWDFSKKINTEYPMCFDCHGNHDIGFPPDDFKLSLWCADCHDKPQKTFPNLASVVDDNDRLWSVLRKVHRRNVALEEDPVPEEFREEVAELRHQTMHAIHKSKEITAREAAKLNQRATALRKALAEWLESKP